jgi:hypothetical protein
MRQNIESLSHIAKLEFLARFAHALTICARDTYETGTGNVVEPHVLRNFNELLHRLTAAVLHHVVGTDGPSIESILEMARDLGARLNRTKEVDWALNRSWQETVKRSTPN